MAGEGALIAPTGLQGDLAEGQVGLAKEAGGLVESQLVEELEGAHEKKAPHALLELVDAEVGASRKILDAEAFREMKSHVLQDRGEFGVSARFFAGCIEVAGDSGHTDDATVLGAQRQLGREAPTGHPARVEMQLEGPIDLLSGFQHDFVLSGVACGESGGKEIHRSPTDEARFVPTGAAIREGAIHDDVTAGCVLEEKDDIGQGVEESLGHGVVVEESGE